MGMSGMNQHAEDTAAGYSARESVKGLTMAQKTLRRRKGQWMDALSAEAITTPAAAPNRVMVPPRLKEKGKVKAKGVRAREAKEKASISRIFFTHNGSK